MFPRLAFFLAVPALLVTLSGCRSAPQRFTPEDLNSPEVIREVAGDYWARNDVPSLWGKGYQRVAITEFVVEFVTLKSENFGESQLMIQPPPVSPIGLAFRATTETTGVMRKVVRFDDTAYQRITDEMFDQLVAELTGKGVDVVPAPRVRSSDIYRRAVSSSGGRETSSSAQLLNQMGSDTGRTQRFEIQPASATGRIDDVAGGRTIEDVEAELLESLGADVSLRVRMRVGVFRGHASIERGSRVWIHSDRAMGNLSLDRSLLSSDMVLTDNEFDLFSGQEYSVDEDRYSSEIERLFPAALRMALETGRRAR